MFWGDLENSLDASMLYKVQRFKYTSIPNESFAENSYETLELQIKTTFPDFKDYVFKLMVSMVNEERLV